MSTGGESDDRPDVLAFGDDPRYKRPGQPLIKAKVKNWENPNTCDHKGTLWVDRSTRTVECDKCGAGLDPIECMFMLQAWRTDIEWKYEEVREHRKKEREKKIREQERRAARSGGKSP